MYLGHVVKAEAIPQWFSDMNKEGQQGYLKDHPNSKIAHTVKNNPKALKSGSRGGTNKPAPHDPKKTLDIIKKNPRVQKALKPNSPERQELAGNLKKYKKLMDKTYKGLDLETRDALRATSAKLKAGKKLDEKDMQGIVNLTNEYTKKNKYGLGKAAANAVGAGIGVAAMNVGGALTLYTGGLAGTLGIGAAGTAAAIAAPLGIGLLAVGAGIYGYNAFKGIRGNFRNLRGKTKINDRETQELLKHKNEFSTITAYFYTKAEDNTPDDPIQTILDHMSKAVQTTNLSPEMWAQMLTPIKSEAKEKEE